MYINGVAAATSSGGGGTLNMTGSTIQIGSNTNGIEPFNGSIANFRLFNRALTADEIWQLYAYQKDYFKVSPDVVTFKAGRLGIGTEEPKAVLDVRGDIYGGCPVFFHATRTTHAESTSSAGFDPLIWQTTRNNKGGGYSTSTGKFTAPIAGYYEFFYGGMSLTASKTFELIPKLNNVDYPGPVVYSAPVSGTAYRTSSMSAIVYMNVGDTWHLRMPAGNQAMYGTNNHYNGFTGKFLSY